MIEIDGSRKSGSGTILRYSVSLCTLLGEDLRVTNIRARRKNPGLRPQHLRSVLACAEMCGGTVERGKVGSREIVYGPGSNIRGGKYTWDIGTAGSTTMLLMTVFPLAFFAKEPCRIRAMGGLFQDYAPSAYHMANVLLPTLAKMGFEATLKVVRPGYVPEGGGVIEAEVVPVRRKLNPLRLLKQGKVREIRGIALSSHLRDRRVSERMAEACSDELERSGYDAEIETIYDQSAVQRGAALAVWANTSTGCILGSDRAGRIGRSSESIGRYVAKRLLEDLLSGATVDRFTADQLIIYASLTKGETKYVIPEKTEHVETNLWLIEEIMGSKTRVHGKRVEIDTVRTFF